MAMLRAVARHVGSTVLHHSGVMRRAAVPAGNPVAILCYHAVIEQPLPVRDPCFITADAFATQMEYLGRWFDVRHLEDALDAPPSAKPVACITFDDGFAGLADHAYPVLERMGLPATTFLVTDLLGTRRAPWFARIHDALTRTDLRCVDLFGTRYDLRTARARARASAELLAALKTVKGELLEQVTAGAVATLMGDDTTASDDFVLMTPATVRRSAASDTVRFGAHTATHPILTQLAPAAAEAEIRRSVAAVKELVTRPSAAFAYPNGQPGDVDAHVVATLASCGVTMGLTTVPGANPSGADRFHLRRHVVTDDLTVARLATKLHNAAGRAASPAAAFAVTPLASTVPEVAANAGLG
jgi:peptidoglycan/xylan/chitin deacetylase (PgdA/CDA1 family)